MSASRFGAGMPTSPDLWTQLAEAVRQDGFLLAASVVFGLAILHAFSAPVFARAAHKLEEAHREAVREGRAPVNDRGESSSLRAAVMHLLGEVEAVFGIWTFVLFGLLIAWPGKGWDFACRYVESGDYAAVLAGVPPAGPSKFVEPLFVFIIMTLAAARPVMALAARLLGGVAWLLGDGTAARWFVILTLAPLFGSLITEPAAMTIGALLLSSQFYVLRPSERLKYATLALLFVNISVGGALTNFAAPPIVMVASKWSWSTADVFAHYGWAAVAAILVSNLTYLVVFRGELTRLKADESGLGDGGPSPADGLDGRHARRASSDPHDRRTARLSGVHGRHAAVAGPRTPAGAAPGRLLPGRIGRPRRAAGLVDLPGHHASE
jgi:hypothetical protein